MASWTEVLPARQGPQVLSKLKMLKNEHQEQALQKTQAQERRINGYRTLALPEEKTWASNWTVVKRTAGVDRAHPLKPLYCNESKVHRFPSASTADSKHMLPHVRSKSGPSRTDQWKELEKREMTLEAEIRRKESILREKLRRTEEELRRIQKEKQKAEQEERRAREISDAKTRPRRTKPGEGDNRDAGKDRWLSIDRYKEGTVKISTYRPLSMDISHQQYGGSRATIHPILQGTSLTHVVDSFNQMGLEAPQVQDSGYPSSEHADDGNISQSRGEHLVPCQLCGRHFMEHRLQKHQIICEKMHSSKRKVFDSSKARAKGTDLEQYLHQKATQLSSAPQEVKTNSWRQKHEAFMRTILQTRVVRTNNTKGGKISHLPPLPIEENPDYLTCPHCSRRFAPRVAEQHIPKCKTIKSKPRPPPACRPKHRK